MTNNSIEKHT